MRKFIFSRCVSRKVMAVLVVCAAVVMTSCGNKSAQNSENNNGNIQASAVATIAEPASDITASKSDGNAGEAANKSAGLVIEMTQEATEPQTEAVTEASTEGQTEPATEAPTEEQTEAPTQVKKTVICLDPGHGGTSQGTHYTYDGTEIEEKNLNYYIATRLKVYLEQYDNIEVVIDRAENVDPNFETRIGFAVENNADYIVSLHNNSKSRDDIEPSGCMAITTCSRYQAEGAVNDDVYGASRSLALSILSSLQQTGLSITIDWDANKTNGILQRVGTGTYPDGSDCDYYGLIRNATYAGIPSVIIEHAFLSNESDYRKYLSSKTKLDALAKADAEGIMNYLNSLWKNL